MNDEQLAHDMKLRRAIDDEERLATLRLYDILNTPPEPDYDEIAELARLHCDTEWAAITLVDSDSQWFKAHQGFPLFQTPRSVSFCSVAMHLNQALIVDDARRDPRFAHNSLVTGDPHLRFYAGFPLVSSEGFPLGAVCVIDMEPRTLFPFQIELLSRIRDWVQARLELRRLDRLIAAADSASCIVQARKWQAFAQYRAEELRALVLPDGPHRLTASAETAKAGTQTTAAP